MRKFLKVLFVAILVNLNVQPAQAQSYSGIRIAEVEPKRYRQNTQQSEKPSRRLQNINACFGKNYDECYELRRDGTMTYMRQKYNYRWREYERVEYRFGTYQIIEYTMDDNTIKSFVIIRFDDGATKKLRIYQGHDGYMRLDTGYGTILKGESL